MHIVIHSTVSPFADYRSMDTRNYQLCWSKINEFHPHIDIPPSKYAEIFEINRILAIVGNRRQTIAVNLENVIEVEMNSVLPPGVLSVGAMGTHSRGWTEARVKARTAPAFRETATKYLKCF